MTSELRRQAHALPALLQIGKNGATPAFLAELQKTLRKKRLVKVRLLRSCPEEPRTAAEAIAEELGVDVISVVGTAVVFSDSRAEKQ